MRIILRCCWRRNIELRGNHSLERGCDFFANYSCRWDYYFQMNDNVYPNTKIDFYTTDIQNISTLDFPYAIHVTPCGCITEGADKHRRQCVWHRVRCIASRPRAAGHDGRRGCGLIGVESEEYAWVLY